MEPGLALGSWAGFLKTGTGDEAVSMGDLVLLEPEVEPVLGELESGGFEILAIHNHLIAETPRILYVYVHFHGHGDAATLAKTLKSALAKTKTPAPGAASAGPTPEQERPSRGCSRLSDARERCRARCFRSARLARSRSGTAAWRCLPAWG